MSEIADEARVSVILADYASVDAINKANVIGAGWQIAGIDPTTGMTAPQSLLVMIDLPPRYYNEDFALAITLLDQAGEPVKVPGPTGEPQAMRIAQLAKAEEPVFPGGNVPRGLVPSHVQVLMSFAAGIALAPGQLYTWQVEIDGDAKPTWRLSFFVAGPPPPPVIG